MAKNDTKIGGLWLSTSQNPKAPFAKGEIEVDGKKIKVAVWRNNSQNPKAPQFTIALDTYDKKGLPSNDAFVDDIPF